MDDGTLVGRCPKNRSSEVHVRLTEYKDTPLVDLRVFMTGGPEPKATRQGLCIQPYRLAELIQILQHAEAEARRRGLIREYRDYRPE
jgi:hypothetical protein